LKLVEKGSVKISRCVQKERDEVYLSAKKEAKLSASEMDEEEVGNDDAD